MHDLPLILSYVIINASWAVKSKYGAHQFTILFLEKHGVNTNLPVDVLPQNILHTYLVAN